MGICRANPYITDRLPYITDDIPYIADDKPYIADTAISQDIEMKSEFRLIQLLNLY